jgi:hypothetical protein
MGDYECIKTVVSGHQSVSRRIGANQKADATEKAKPPKGDLCGNFIVYEV